MSESPAGSSVQWVNNSSANYQSIFGKSGAKTMAKNFRVFLDPA